MTMLIKQQAGDTAIGAGLDSGQTSIPTSGTPNFIRLNPQTVTHNSSVSPTAEPVANTYDVTVYGSDIVVADVIAMSFICTLVALNTNSSTNGIPIVYVKLIGALSASGVGYDLVIPMTPGQIFTWVNPANASDVQPHATTDPNGNRKSQTAIH